MGLQAKLRNSVRINLWYIRKPMEREYPYSIPTVSLGGGTGHFGYLRGAVQINHPECNTAIPATWDGKGKNGNGGGSSGELRISQGVLPPGDKMQCLVALMETEPQFKEAMLILRDREDSPHPLVNQLAATSEKKHHGAQEGIDALRRLFNVRGRIILPSTTDLRLDGESKNGVKFNGEGDIDSIRDNGEFHLSDEVSRIWFDTEPEASELAQAALRNARKIVVTAGSPYTSIFPQLLIKGNREAILESEAELDVVLNISFLKTGEDHHLNIASRWLKVFQYYLRDDEYIRQHGKSRINYAIGHDFQRFDTPELQEGIERYEAKGQRVVKIDKEICEAMAPGIRVIMADIADYDRDSHLIRYDYLKLARTVFSASPVSLPRSIDQMRGLVASRQ